MDRFTGSVRGAVARALSVGALLGVTLAGIPALADQVAGEAAPAGEYSPKLKEASDEAEKAIRNFTVAPGLKVDLFAAEPMLANPVCLYIDYSGRIYVAETFRHHAGVTDMRNHRKWLDDDLAARTVEDRLAAMKKNLGLEFLKYKVHHERVRLIEDTDGDGKADKATVFADGFKDPLDGIGAGLLATPGGDVYYTNLPHLWRLRDDNGDGKADTRESLSYGYGVHIGFLGHDLHGLRRGPDGRLYFSIGDRGVHITTREGKLIDLPDTGAVFRCEMDGSNLEVFHSGLRNPQELVFTELGDLFTGDNNSDAGDQARWVYVVPGGETGWSIGWQWIADPTPRGPWNKEGMWKPRDQAPYQPAYILPALANIGAGPSGLTYDPGVGLNEHYRGRFFLCDFRGGNTGSLIHSFHVKPKGAAFEVTDLEEVIKGVLATDVDFGPDGALYLTDWIQGWDQPKAGRIYRILDPATANEPDVAETKKILAEGFSKRSFEELVELLEKPDQRVRLEAQWELAARGEEGARALMAAIVKGRSELARIHGLWGTGQAVRLARNANAANVSKLEARADAAIGEALRSTSPEMTRQAARVAGELQLSSQTGQLIEIVKKDDARAQFAAAISLGQIGAHAKDAAEPVLEMLRRNNDADAYLRHAGVMALVGCADDATLASKSSDASPAVRMGALLALRRMNSPAIAVYLDDAEPRLVAEAARAVSDRPIEGAFTKLAALIDKREALYAWPEEQRKGCLEPTLLRALNAHFRLGGAENARAIATLAADPRAPEDARLEAVRELKDWAEPRGVDRVTGVWRPVGKRDGAPAKDALRGQVAAVLAGAAGGPEGVLKEAARLAGEWKLTEAEPGLLGLAQSVEAPGKARVEALRALGDLKSAHVKAAVAAARASDNAELRSEGMRQLTRLDPADALHVITEALSGESAVERQGAIQALSELKTDAARAELDRWLAKLEAGEAPAEIQYELIEAANADDTDALKARVEGFRKKAEAGSPVAGHSELMAGGRADAGEKVFFEKVEAQCQKCHQIAGKGGGEVGPKLDDVGSRKDRLYILESILHPNAQIAPGFENVTLTLKDGAEIMGRVLSENDTEIELEIPIEEEAKEFIEEDETEGAAKREEKEQAEKFDNVIADGENNPHPENKPTFERRTVQKVEVKERRRNLSSMPEDLKDNLTRAEIRDLVEFLANRR